jgi:hypothetical protein
MPITPKAKTHRSHILSTLLAGACLSSTALAGDYSKEMNKSVLEPEQSAKVDLLLNFEFSDKYVTPRGQIVRDKGVTIQPLLLAFLDLYKSDKTFFNDFKIVGGIWNDFGSSAVAKHPPFGSKPDTNYTESDPIFGISTTFLKKFTFEATYTAFIEQILDIGTSHHVFLKLSYDDSDLLKGFALHPYFMWWRELSGKSTAADVPYAVFGKKDAPGPSYYFEIGITPGYTFKQLGDLRLDLPCRVLLPSSDFYGEFYHSASTVGLFEVGAKLTYPLKFMPKNYGFWSLYAGYRYMNFVDENLQQMQAFNSPGKAVEDVHQVYGGLTIFF